LNILALTYWSFNEPLVQSATLPHLRSIRRSMGPEGKLFLLTLEKANIALEGEELAEVKAQFEAEGIYLIPKAYHRFGIKAVLSWILYILSLRRLCKRENIKCLHAFATPIGSAAYILSRLTGIPFIVDSFEPHAESMVENKSWKSNSFVFKLLFFFEKRQTRYAFATLSASPKMPEYTENRYKLRPAYNLYKPAGVNLEQFKPKDQNQFEKRLALGLKGQVCVYAGKFGGIYLEREVFRFFASCYKHCEGDFSVLLLSDASRAVIEQYATEEGFPLEALVLMQVKHSEVPEYLALADFAINPVKPVPSKRYCTSIKDGEYWAMGLPVVIPPGISNDSELIETHRAGVIWEGFDNDSCDFTAKKIFDYLESETLEERRLRIRWLATEERDIKLFVNHYQELYAPKGLVDQGVSVFVVLIYNSFMDPLFQNLMYQYILTQSERHPNYRFELLTFDTKKYVLSGEKKTLKQAELSGKGVYWQPLLYHSGNLLLLKKLYDFLAALFKGIKIRFYSNPIMTLSFANNAAAITIILSKLLGTKHMVYGYEPHSQFMAEFGIWKRSDIRYKVLKKLEDLTDMTSDYIVTGTDHLKLELESRKTKSKVYRAPCSVDENIFNFYPEERERIRQEHGWEGRKILIYVGKFGGVYYDEEVPLFVKELKTLIPDLYFLVLSPNDHNELRMLFQEAGLSEDDYYLTEAKSAYEVADWNSAADAAITAIPPLPSQRFRSPVKVGEYLMCGLPFITCKGISEDDIWAKKYNVGIVISEMSIEETPHTADELQEFWKEDPTDLRMRCRIAGIEYRSKKIVDEVFEEILTEVHEMH